ncbi:MAG TPA: hypothetical protein VFC19_07100 [Candidatus Limnocylindrales bacterium]|nr:hypothetical protein [Candidatus Limnocylindrales bacterium]
MSTVPIESPPRIQRWAELHVDDMVLRLVPPWGLEELGERLERAMATGKLVRVRAYTEFNGETTVLVNPARARVVFLAFRPEIVPFSGMPDPVLAPGVTPDELGDYLRHEA